MSSKNSFGTENDTTKRETGQPQPVGHIPTLPTAFGTFFRDRFALFFC